MSKQDTILVVVGDSAATGYFKAGLGARYEIRVTSEPAEALSIARMMRPDLIICDAVLPGASGLELCRSFKSDPLVRDTPVVFLSTGEASVEEQMAGFAAGAVDYIQKGFDRALLAARLRVHLELRRARRDLAGQNAQLEARVAERTAALEENRKALREAMHNLRTTRVSAGVYWVQVPEAGLYILCGSPADVVKHLMLRGYIAEETRDGVAFETGPNAILLSDVLIQNGRFASLSEFPVLQMLYRQGMIVPGHPNNSGRKPMLIGSREQVRAQLDYIHRGNYGLVSEEELRAAGLDAQEAKRQMALKLGFAFGGIKPSEELLDVRIAGPESVELANGVTVRRAGLNRYVFGYRGRSTQVDLNLAPGESYDAPYTSGNHKVRREDFAVIHCGEGDGWDLRRQSMGSIVVFQGRFYLVDAGPSILHTLNALGIDVSEIEGIFHTHSHDDHFAGLPTLIAAGHRLKYFATPLVRHSVTKKLAALMSMDERLFAEFFDVRDLAVDQWNDCDGMQVMPMYSPHPVENNIFIFRALGDDGHRSYAHWADIVSIDGLGKMLADPAVARALPADFVDQVRERYLTPASLKKVDAGLGMIHGDPMDFAEDKSAKIVLAHRAAPFTDAELDIGSSATFGAVDVLISTHQDYVRQRAYRFLSEIFPEAGIDVLNALLRAPIRDYNAGSIILRRGAETDRVFLLLTGSVEYRAGDFPTPSLLATGSLLGIEAVFEEGPLKNSWRAASPVRVLSLGVASLRTFLLDNGWHATLRELVAESAFLGSTRLFGEHIPFTVHSRLARASRIQMLKPEERYAGRGEPTLIMVRSGCLQLSDAKGRSLELLGPGNFAGEEACLGHALPHRRCEAQGEVEIQLIPAAELRAIPVVMWKLIETHERRQRSAEFGLEDAA